MPKYIVTRMATEQVIVTAGNHIAAVRGALAADFVSKNPAYHVERIYEEFEYRVYSEQDSDMSEDDWEDAGDIAYFREHGARVVILEHRPTDTEDGMPGDWEVVGRMGGCVGDHEFLVEIARDLIRDNGIDPDKVDIRV